MNKARLDRDNANIVDPQDAGDVDNASLDPSQYPRAPHAVTSSMFSQVRPIYFSSCLPYVFRSSHTKNGDLKSALSLARPFLWSVPLSILGLLSEFFSGERSFFCLSAPPYSRTRRLIPPSSFWRTRHAASSSASSR